MHSIGQHSIETASGAACYHMDGQTTPGQLCSGEKCIQEVVISNMVIPMISKSTQD